MTIKQLGGVFGRNPTFNDVTIEGVLTFDGDIDINSDLKVDGDLDVTGTAIVENLGVNVSSITSGFRAEIYEPSNDGLNIQAGNAGAKKILSLGSPSTANKVVFTAGGDIDMTVGGGDIIFKSGSGIDFSATAGAGTSELFDDYEEGAWQGTLRGSSGEPATLITAWGYYTKIGRDVSIQISFESQDTTGYSGNISVEGLPFTSALGRSIMNIAQYNAGTYTGSPYALLNSGSTTLLAYVDRSANSFTQMTHNAGAARSLWITGVYKVA